MRRGVGETLRAFGRQHDGRNGAVGVLERLLPVRVRRRDGQVPAGAGRRGGARRVVVLVVGMTMVCGRVVVLVIVVRRRVRVRVTMIVVGRGVRMLVVGMLPVAVIVVVAVMGMRRQLLDVDVRMLAARMVVRDQGWARRGHPQRESRHDERRDAEEALHRIAGVL